MKNAQWLRHVRPAALGSFLKRIIGIKRQNVRSHDGLLFLVDPVSHFGNEMMSTGTYEPKLSDLFRCLLKSNDLVLDIGANEGYFSVLAGSLTGRKVIAIEPQSALKSVIEQNATLNHLTIELHSLALGSEAGSAVLNVPPDINSGAASLVRKARFARMESITVNTLDALAAAHEWPKIRLIKMDCEGFEEAIVSGGRTFLGSHASEFVSIDYHPHIAGAQSPFRVDSAMRDFGYELTEAANGCWIYHLPGLESELASMGEYRSVNEDLLSPRKA